jgi:hypothetical protein
MSDAANLSEHADDALRAIAFQNHVQTAADNGIPIPWLAQLLRCSDAQIETAIHEARLQATEPSWVPSEDQHDASFSLSVLSDGAQRHGAGRDWATTPLAALGGRSPMQAVADGDLGIASEAIRGGR